MFDNPQVLKGATLVEGTANGQFNSIKPGDRITLLVLGVEATRTVSSVNYLAAPARLSVNSAFSAAVALSKVSYTVERPMLTMASEHSLLVGGSSGDKTLSLRSTDASASLDVTALGKTHEAAVLISAQAARSSTTVRAGLDKDAALVLKSSGTRAHGFALTRGSGATNELRVERSTQGYGGTATAAAGGKTLVSKNNGDFAQIRVGDRIVVHTGGVQSSALVTAVNLIKNPDELTLNQALSGVKLQDVPYEIYRSVMTTHDDDRVRFFGNRGTKTVDVESQLGSATLSLRSAGALGKATLSVAAGSDYADVRVQSGNDKDSRIYMVDSVGNGFLVRKSQGTVNALSGTTLASSINALTFERTIALPRTTATVSANAKANKLEAQTDNDFAKIRVGDLITVILNGVEVQRTVTMMTLGSTPDQLLVNAAFSNSALVKTSYYVTRPLMSFEDYNSLLIGGTMGAAAVNIESSHDSATLKLKASDSPQGRPDSVTHQGHADLAVVSDSVATVRVEAGSTSPSRSGDARLKFKDLNTATGFMTARMSFQGNTNQFVNFHTQSSVAHGNVMSCDAKSKIVKASSSTVNAFQGISVGDFVMASVAGIDVIRRVDAVNHGVEPDTLQVNAPFHASLSIKAKTWELLRPVTTLADDSNYLFGGTTRDKQFAITSTLGAVSLSAIAAGTLKRAIFTLGSADTVDADWYAKPGQDVRLKLRDDYSGFADGFVFTRAGALKQLHLDQWKPGTGDIDVAKNSKVARSNSNGDFSNVSD